MAKLDAKAVRAQQIISRKFADSAQQKGYDELKQAVETLQQLGADLAGSPANGGRFVTTALGVTAAPIKHNLGRSYAGYLIVAQDANAAVWTDLPTNKDPTNSVSLIASAPVNVKVWFF